MAVGWSPMTARLAVVTRHGKNQIAPNWSAPALSVLISWNNWFNARKASIHTFLIEGVSILDLIERVKLALNEYCGTVAMFTDVSGVVTNDNQ